jgi:hypothetical protein
MTVGSVTFNTPLVSENPYIKIIKDESLFFLFARGLRQPPL